MSALIVKTAVIFVGLFLFALFFLLDFVFSLKVKDKMPNFKLYRLIFGVTFGLYVIIWYFVFSTLACS